MVVWLRDNLYNDNEPYYVGQRYNLPHNIFILSAYINTYIEIIYLGQSEHEAPPDMLYIIGVCYIMYVGICK